MSALDGFYSTWDKARETFGVGTPPDGSQYDGSSQLLRMKGMIDSAAKHDGWQGTGADAYAAANKEHANVYGKLAELDKQMAAEVTNAANIVTTGREQLDATKSWVDSAVSSLPGGLSAQENTRFCWRTEISKYANPNSRRCGSCFHITSRTSDPPSRTQSRDSAPDTPRRRKRRRHQVNIRRRPEVRSCGAIFKGSPTQPVHQGLWAVVLGNV